MRKKFTYKNKYKLFYDILRNYNIFEQKIGLMQQRNKIYFKVNAFPSNSLLPSSGQRNRAGKKFLMEVPEGQDLAPIRKKQFLINQHHQSEIKDLGLFSKEEKVKKHNNLDIDDIEGACPLTVTQKAQRHMNQKPYLIHKVKADSSLPSNTSRLQTISYQANHSTSKTPTNLNYSIGMKKQQTSEPNFVHPELPHPKKEGKQQKKQIEKIEERKHQPILSPLQRSHEEPTIIEKKNTNRIFENTEKNLIRNEPIAEKQQLQKEKGVKNLKGKKDLQSMWHGDSHKITLLPPQELRRWNPTFLPENPYFPKITPT